MVSKDTDAERPSAYERTLLVYHGDKSVELIPVCTSEPLQEGDTVGMRQALTSLETRDVFKVKIDDGKFFGGKDLRLWLCDRLNEELAFGAAVRKELDDERSAARHEFDRLADMEKELKESLKKGGTDLATTERRLNDAIEALRFQKDLRMQEMLQKESAEKDVSSLKSEAASLVGRINIQADVTAAMEKECQALRSVVRLGRKVRAVDEEEEKRGLRENFTREEEMVRLKRRVYAAEKENGEWTSRLARAQREAERLRGILWSNNINPTVVVRGAPAKNAGGVIKTTIKGAGHWRRGGARPIDRANVKQQRLAPLESMGSPESMASSVYVEKHRPIATDARDKTTSNKRDRDGGASLQNDYGEGLRNSGLVRLEQLVNESRSASVGLDSSSLAQDSIDDGWLRRARGQAPLSLGDDAASDALVARHSGMARRQSALQELVRFRPYGRALHHPDDGGQR